MDKKKEGEWLFWNIEEQIYLRGSYVNGLRHGTWTRYFRDGEKMRISYENGEVKGKALGGVIRIEK